MPRRSDRLEYPDQNREILENRVNQGFQAQAIGRPAVELGQEGIPALWRARAQNQEFGATAWRLPTLPYLTSKAVSRIIASEWGRGNGLESARDILDYARRCEDHIDGRASKQRVLTPVLGIYYDSSSPAGTDVHTTFGLSLGDASHPGFARYQTGETLGNEMERFQRIAVQAGIGAGSEQPPEQLWVPVAAVSHGPSQETRLEELRQAYAQTIARRVMLSSVQPVTEIPLTSSRITSHF